MSGRCARRGPVGWMALVLLMLAVPVASGEQASQTQASAGTIVLGRIVDSATDSPIGGATVRLRGPREVEPKEAFSNADGRVVFRDVGPGDYQVSAVLAGYEPAPSSRLLANASHPHLTVERNQPVADFTLRMSRFAAVTGIVVDELGEPAVGVEVKVLRAAMAGGQTVLVNESATSISDDRGAYRVPNLLPGRYYVYVPSTVESAPTSLAAWYADARQAPGAEAEWLRTFRESQAPSPSPNGLRIDEQVVKVAVRPTAIDPTLTASGRLEVYPTVFHPGARRIDQAIAVTVTSGEQRGGVDLQLARASAQRISGEVIGPDGPAAHMGVRLLPVDARGIDTVRGLETAATMTGPDGHFTLMGVPPGDYVVEVLRVAQATSAQRVPVAVVSAGGARAALRADGPPEVTEAADDATLWAEQDVTVADADIRNLTVRLRRGVRLTGRIEFVGTPPPAEAMTRFAVQLRPVNGKDEPAFLRPPPVAPDGSFRTLSFPPGRYFIGLTAGAQWFVKSAVVAGRDLVDQPIELAAEDLEGLVLTLTDRLSELNGTVARPTAASSDVDVLVAAFPADHAAWIADGMPASRAALAIADSEGNYTLAGLREGSYLAVALPAETAVDLQDPDVIGLLARLGTVVQLPERGASSLRLQVSRVR